MSLPVLVGERGDMSLTTDTLAKYHAYLPVRIHEVHVKDIVLVVQHAVDQTLPDSMRQGQSDQIFWTLKHYTQTKN